MCCQIRRNINYPLVGANRQCGIRGAAPSSSTTFLSCFGQLWVFFVLDSSNYLKFTVMLLLSLDSYPDSL